MQIFMEVRHLGIRLKSLLNGNHLGLVLVYPDGNARLVAEVLLPMDGDWRADVQFYDDLEEIYRKRLRKAGIANNRI